MDRDVPLRTPATRLVPALSSLRGLTMGLSGKTALVTGSTSGIGLGIATTLATAGVNIVLNGFGDAAAIEKLRSDLARQHNVGVAYSNADISKPAQIADMIALADKEFRGVDILGHHT